VYSEPGHGTSFKVYVPAARGESSTVSSPVLSSVKSDGETVLVAEDEEAIAELIHDMLSAQGYNVLVAKTSEEAIRLAHNEKGDIHL
jgi:PleD family two-component response regulator